jgi:hypothetical protein
MSSLEIESLDYAAESGLEILVAFSYSFVVLFPSVKVCDENREDHQYNSEND